MVYYEAMQLLSQFDIGMLLVSADYFILEINDAGDRLLHGEGRLKGRDIRDAAPQLYASAPEGAFFNIGFQEYLARCRTPEGILFPAESQLICFRDVTPQVLHHMMQSIVDLIPEPIIMADEKRRVMFINDATMRMEALLQEDVEGKDIIEIYPNPSTSFDKRTEPELTVPIVIRTRKPILNCHQIYETNKGKRLNIMCSSYPIFKDDQILGVFCVTADSSRVEILSKRIIDLQEKLQEKVTSSGKTRKGRLSAKYTFSDIIHQSKAMEEVLRKAEMSARSDSSVMICGETGTGKEMVAQGIHNAGNRAQGPFIAVNCAAIPENLLESMLFGTEKGAFTGAERRPGLFEQADGGTLMLDELNSMGLNLQAKLLRVLQDGAVRRVGGTEEKHVDVRLLSALNVSPYQAIAEKRLREDLYYRLGVVSITIPPLRKRREDIPILSRIFFRNLNDKLSKSVTSISEEVLALFYAYDWPGNVRELQHCMEHAINLMPDDETVIRSSYLPEHLQSRIADIAPRAGEKTDKGGMLENFLSGIEYQLLTDYLSRNNGNISRTAGQLGVSRQNLQHRLKHYGIDAKTIHAYQDR